MIDIKQFSELKKNSAKSFNDQKALIKKVMSGRLIKCKTCGQPLQLMLPENSSQPGIYCQKRCTDISLDFA
ncbi:MAG: hypothetical protein HRT52_24005 [Colwellia sp.]|nr:hypothetical protein [Colwellia sp.]